MYDGLKFLGDYEYDRDLLAKFKERPGEYRNANALCQLNKLSYQYISIILCHINNACFIELSN